MARINDQPGSTARRGPVPIFVSVELSRVRWLITWTFHGSPKMSKTFARAGDGEGLLALLAQIRTRAEQSQRSAGKIIVVHEAGLDGFWIHRLLESRGLESHVVDPASVAVPRRQRRPKSDAIDGETLLRVLMAWKRGEPRVCSMVVPHRKTRRAGVWCGSARCWWPNAPARQTAFAGCSRARVLSITTRCAAIAGFALRG